MAKTRILLVEDDPDLVSLFREDAVEAGIDLEVVSTLSELKATDLDVSAVVLDLQIPPDSVTNNPDVEVGVEALTWLALKGVSSRTLVYSAWDGISNRVKALDTGAIFRTKAECSSGQLFEVLRKEILGSGGQDAGALPTQPSQEQKDLRITQEILNSTEAGPEVAVGLATVILEVDDVKVFKINRRESRKKRRLILETAGQGDYLSSDSKEASALLDKKGVRSLATLCEGPVALSEGLSIIPIHKRGKPSVFCLLGRSVNGSISVKKVQHFYYAFRPALWHLLQERPASGEIDTWSARAAARIEKWVMGFMNNWVRPVVGTFGFLMALLGIVVGSKAFVAFVPVVLSSFQHGGSHGDFAIGVLGFVEEMWLFVLLLVFSLGILNMAGQRYQDEAPAWLERYSDLGSVKRMLIGLISTILAVAYLRFVFVLWDGSGEVDALRHGGAAVLALGGILSLGFFLLAMGKAE